MINQIFKLSHTALALALLTLCGWASAAPLVDPTRPPDALLPGATNASATGPLQVTAVFIYPDRSIALINNQYVKVGEVIGSYTVINIQRDTVELKDSHDARVTLAVVPNVKTAVTVK